MLMWYPEAGFSMTSSLSTRSRWSARTLYRRSTWASVVFIDIYAMKVFIMLTSTVEAYRYIDLRYPDSNKFYSDVEAEHDPYWLNVPYKVNGTSQDLFTVNGTEFSANKFRTPNWMLEEPPFRPMLSNYYKFLYWENNRPYRLSPVYKIVPEYYRYNDVDRLQEHVGCYCTTSYKKYTLLAGCAVLTTRHILTTATSTELVLKNNRHLRTLKGILGFWYQGSYSANILAGFSRWFSHDYSNGTYFHDTISRIHYHPKYLRPEKVNITHPVPFLNDLAVWSTAHPLYYKYPYFCQRAAPSRYEYLHSKPRKPDTIMVVGYQYIKSHGKVPKAWAMYGTRTDDYSINCPKLEWGEYFCIGSSSTEHWSKYGIESGAAMHRLTKLSRSLFSVYDWSAFQGLAGLAAFSMRLRSDTAVHYFTVLNVHPVIDFLHDAYTGKLPYEYLDYRYQNTKGKAPIPHLWHDVGDWDPPHAEQGYKGIIYYK